MLLLRHGVVDIDVEVVVVIDYVALDDFLMLLLTYLLLIVFLGVK